jgi:outer membrane protein assembly factor BamB
MVGAVLAVLAVILTGKLLAFSQRQQPNQRQLSKHAPPANQPTINSQPIGGIRTLLPSTVKPIQTQATESYGSQITIAGGVAYVGSATRAFYALRASDGSLLWSTNLNGSAIASPVVSDGVVYVATYAENTPVYIFALRASDGKQFWHYNTQTNLWNNFTIDHGFIYTTSHDGAVALHASDGLPLWDTRLKRIPAFPVSPA